MKQRVFVLALQLVLLLPGLAFSAHKAVIVGFKQKPGPSQTALIHGAKGVITRTYELIPAMAASLPEEEIEKLRKSSDVAYVEETAVYRAAAEPLAGGEYEESWGVWRILSDVAHESGNKGAGVRVAIIDTGIDYTHEDLDGHYRGGYDYVFDDDDPFDDSFNSHGTHVAGIVGAEENGVGVVGVAPEVELFAVKVLDGAGFGTEEWIIAGIEWAVANGIDIINLSLEGPDRQALQDACDMAYEAGLLLVAAAGNSQSGGGPVEYPAAYDSVIAAAATDPSDMAAQFSAVGDEVELAAPGVDVVSTGSGGSYHALSGTSQAAAHVSGAAALYLLSTGADVNSDGLVNNEDVRLMLQGMALDLGDSGKDQTYGHGLVNAAGAAFGSSDVILSVTRTSAAPALDAKAARITGAPHDITITNLGLANVRVDVFEGTVLRKDLSQTIRFGPTAPQQVVLQLDATGARYDLFFTPRGQPGTSADIVIARDGL